jgi:molybdopterin converting factor subunit 1
MELRVLLFASAKEAVGAAEVKLPASRASTVRELTAALAEAYPALAQLLPSSMIAVNQEYAEEDDLVGPSDEVALIPPISGG